MIHTSIPIIPPGTPVEGGFHACFLPRLDGGLYQLILPPKAVAYFSNLTWEQSAGVVADLKGCTLPNRLDGAALYHLFAPHKTTTPEAFRAGAPEAFAAEWYWLDEEYEFYPGYAWVQSFDNGGQYDVRKHYRSHCRAVRKVLI